MTQRTDKQQLFEIQTRIRKLVNDVIQPSSDQIDREKLFPTEHLSALAQAGFNGILLPKELGGLGLSYQAFTLVVQEIARACPSTALIYTMHVEAARVIYEHGTKDQWVRWLKPIQHGKIGTTSTSEGETGGHYWFNLSEAEVVPGGYRLNAKKSFVTSSGYADFYVLQTKSPHAESPSDLTYFIVDGRSDGIESGQWDALGVHGNHSSSLTLTNVFVPLNNRIGAEGEGKDIVQNGIAYLLGLGATWTGTAIGIFDETLSYAKQKVHKDVNRALTEYQVIRSLLAKGKIIIDSLKAWQKVLASQVDEWSESGDRFAPEWLKNELLEFKVLSSDSANELAQIGLDVSGGFGYKRGTLERFYRDARAGMVMGPSNHLARDMIGKALVGLKMNLWE